MGKFLLAGIAASLGVAAFFAITVSTSSGTEVAQAASAVVIKDGRCTVLDGEGVLVSGSGHAVINDNNTNAVCKMKDVANSTGKAIHYDTNNNPRGAGLPCGTPIGTTTDWKETISASGNATLVCHVR